MISFRVIPFESSAGPGNEIDPGSPGPTKIDQVQIDMDQGGGGAESPAGPGLVLINSTSGG